MAESAEPERSDRHLPAMLAAAGSVLALDQLTKWWALDSLDNGRIIDLFWTLRLRLVFNTGAAFSRFDDLGPVLGIVAVIVTVGLLLSGRLAPDRPTSVALGCIAGGSMGNIADRLFREGEGFLGGAVVDFIDVQWWPVWNVADMGIVCGGAALVWFTGRRERASAEP